jgi:deoxyribodipyrimidine photolyase-related protein
MPKLCLILGDQLSLSLTCLQMLDKDHDHIMLAELYTETHYVKHNKLKIALIFSAMRHFAAQLRAAGFHVEYYAYEDTKDSFKSFTDVVIHQLSRHQYHQLVCTEPGEYRVLNEMHGWQKQWNIETNILADNRFFFSLSQMSNWFSEHKEPRMEHFYQFARKQTGLLMENNKPLGGRFNFDKENRHSWQADTRLPPKLEHHKDDITQTVIRLVEQEFPDFPGDLHRFNFAVERQQALDALNHFIEHKLPQFGHFQDALSDQNNTLFHSLLASYINIGLLLANEVCEVAIDAYHKQRAPLNAVEGFVRQILGWREYVRGLYWHQGESYKDNNALNAFTPLPSWFWHSKTKMRCMSKAIGHSLEDAYAHHIQRLMIIGNFALIAGLDVKQVCEWYLAVYIDAFEWVELPNTLGMALYADNGLLASKPYAASANYINKMGNHCSACSYNPKLVTGSKACPFNALYWRFIQRHQNQFSANPRMSLMVKQWQKKDTASQQAIIQWADTLIEKLELV